MFARQNLELFVNEENSDYFCLKIAKINCLNGMDFVLDNRFIPSCLRLKTSIRLLDIVNTLISLVSGKVLELNSARNHGYNIELLKYVFLYLNHLLIHPKYHPEKLYLCLLKLLAILKVNTQQYDEFIYNHNDLSTSFNSLYDLLVKSLNNMGVQSDRRLQFDKSSDGVCYVDGLDEEFLQSSSLFLAVYFDSKESWSEEFVSSIKLSSRLAIKGLISSSLYGVKVSSRDFNKDGLSRSTCRYFSIDQSGSLWQQIFEEGNIALYLPKKFWQARIELVALFGGG